jgi:integrase
VVWSASRIAAWLAVGVCPALAVWTPRQSGRFPKTVRGDRLYALWWLLALRGLRRGEAAALRWTDLDLDRGELTVARSRTAAGYQVHGGPPKTAAGCARFPWTAAQSRTSAVTATASRPKAATLPARCRRAGLSRTR